MAVRSSVIAAPHVSGPAQRSHQLSLPWRCSDSTAREMRYEAGMSIVRLSITDCVTPIALRPSVSCSRKCTATTAVAVAISQRAVVANAVSWLLLWGTSSLSVSSAISTTAVNCIVPNVKFSISAAKVQKIIRTTAMRTQKCINSTNLHTLLREFIHHC